MEAGTNDIVVLPILLVLIAIAHGDLGGPTQWLGFLGQLLVLGPAAGFAIGAAGSWVMGRVDQRFHIRPEYQSLVDDSARWHEEMVLDGVPTPGEGMAVPHELTDFQKDFLGAKGDLLAARRQLAAAGKSVF